MKRICLGVAVVSSSLVMSACAHEEVTPGGAEAAGRALPSGPIWIGTLAYGDTSDPVLTGGLLRFRAFRFEGEAGDHVTVDVRSIDGGDAQTWLIGDRHVLAYNDDGADGSPDSRIELTLLEGGTHFILFRDARHRRRTFTVELQGGPAQASPLAIGLSFGTSRLVTFDPAAGTVEEVHMRMGPEVFIGMTHDPDHNLLYAVSQVTHNLYAIDPATMTSSHFGNLRIPQGGSVVRDVQALAYDPIDEVLHGTIVRFDDLNDPTTWRTDLVRIDIGTASPTVVGTIPQVFVSGLDFNTDDGQLVGLARGGDGLNRIIRIDPADASSEEVLVTPYQVMLGLARIPGTNRYLSWINADSHFYGEIDLDSATIRPLGSSDAINALAAFVVRTFDAASVPVPREEEPASFEIAGRVVDVRDPLGLLGGAIATGDCLTGRIAYDVNAPYRHADEVVEGVYGLSVIVGDMAFSVDAPVGSVANNFYEAFNGSVTDGISLTASRPGSPGFPVPMNFEQIRWTLIDSTAVAVSNNDRLPLAYDLAAWDRNELEIRGGSDDSSNDGYTVVAVVDAITAE